MQCLPASNRAAGGAATAALIESPRPEMPDVLPGAETAPGVKSETLLAALRVAMDAFRAPVSVGRPCQFV